MTTIYQARKVVTMSLSPQNKSGKCSPCVRYEMSPVSRAAQLEYKESFVFGSTSPYRTFELEVSGDLFRDPDERRAQIALCF